MRSVQILLLIIITLAALSCSGLESHEDSNSPVGLEKGEAVDQDASGVENPAYKAGEVLVKFKKHVAAARVEEITGELGLEIIREISAASLYLLRIQGDATVPDVVKRLGRYEEVEYSEPNYFRNK